MTAEVCRKLVSDGGRSVTSHPCGRPAKEDGLCGIHLRASRNRKIWSEAINDKMAASDRARADAEELLAQLGLSGRAAYDWRTGVYTGEVVLSADEVRGLAGDPT